MHLLACTSISAVTLEDYWNNVQNWVQYWWYRPMLILETIWNGNHHCGSFVDDYLILEYPVAIEDTIECFKQLEFFTKWIMIKRLFALWNLIQLKKERIYLGKSCLLARLENSLGKIFKIICEESRYLKLNGLESFSL